jgi:hypothetical protein
MRGMMSEAESSDREAVKGIVGLESARVGCIVRVERAAVALALLRVFWVCEQTWSWEDLGYCIRERKRESGKGGKTD